MVVQVLRCTSTEVPMYKCSGAGAGGAEVQVQRWCRGERCKRDTEQLQVLKCSGTQNQSRYRGGAMVKRWCRGDGPP